MSFFNNGNNSDRAARYFLMFILTMITMTVIYMIVTGQDVPETIAIPFSMIVSYLLGVKTPERTDNNEH